ncbi:sulfite reductase flavoprotein subunit alpha [Pseudomonas sp. PS02288]|uniref:sulfite reductase flavoprotein subunit alpha n=1 Tax=Pseudomonas sp. PS02288 TaxID=2991443 RepID=UPI00249A7857|nr:sulfite reductase flavoprotein subunit alpha [Pseudomonas sp. PS02288]
MFKKTIFQLHWFFGISAGLVLALMGLTGAIYEFQDEILELINPQMQVERRDAQVLPLGELAARAQALEGKTVSGVYLILGDGDPARVFFTPPPGERRGAMRFLDPYTGDAMGEPRGMGFFAFVLQLHRFLAAGEVGKQITAASTLALVFFCLSGLYLRWPRKALNWRAWLTLDWAKKGRAFNWDLHAVAGTWCLVFYLCAALTGLTWSYDWFRDGANRLLGDAPTGQQGKRGEGRGRPGGQTPGAAPTAAPVVDYDLLWNSIRQTAGDHLAGFNLRLPLAAGQPATVFYLLDDSPHPRALNQIQLDTATGKVLRHERYADKNLGPQLLISIYALHTGEYFGLPGRILMMLASLGMPLFFVTGWLLYLDRRRKKREIRAARVGVAGDSSAQGWLIGFASQSGLAEQLAWRAAGQLQAAGVPVQVQPLMRIDEQALRQTRNALFVVSTFGDGEAPDNARSFERKMLGQRLDLGSLHYAVLALGDRQYQQFCGFARRVDAWLSGAGARTLFDAVEVDDGDSAAIADWQLRLNEVTGTRGPLEVAPVPFDSWPLQRRVCLNPGSQGAPTFLVGLAPRADWCAGDILEVLPRHPPEKVRRWLDGHGLAADAPVTLDGLAMPLLDALCTRQLPDSFVHLVGLHPQTLLDALVPLGVREYSIASLPCDGVLELIVRQEFHPDGSLGLGSGWLSEHAPLHAGVRARVRRNSAFHVPEDDRPLILIGNGSGLAGLRSLLKARIVAGQRRNWLLFGERNRAHDFYCAEEIQAWLASGELQRLDLAFSRDQERKRYVQDVLGENLDELRRWLEQGASIYVCGSLVGMAGGVDALLLEALGEQGLADLTEAGRYRRDVY